jgi:hypothetical protein
MLLVLLLLLVLLVRLLVCLNCVFRAVCESKFESVRRLIPHRAVPRKKKKIIINFI